MSRKKRKGRVSKEGIKSGSTESITTAIWLNAIFARSLKIICQTAYHDFRQWITVGIPLCNRGRLLTALSSFFIAAPFSTVTRYILSFSRFFLAEADLISSMSNVAYNFARVDEESILAGSPSLYLLIRRLA